MCVYFPLYVFFMFLQMNITKNARSRLLKIHKARGHWLNGLMYDIGNFDMKVYFYLD